MFGAGINKGDWIPSKREERALRLYWYLVFDEWYTCKYVSKEEQLNALWDRYRCGAISALKNKKFLDDIDDMFKQKAYFFGLREQFKLEINAMKAEAIELKRMDSNS
jgi:hypothetical protein